MRNETRLAILFADVCASTRLYETLGDARAHDAITRCLAIMSEATSGHGGRVVKTIGDEVMSTFDSADAAAQAAAAMQEAISEGFILDGTPVSIRVGFHFGTALVEHGDVYGDAVNVAARMTDQAKAGQILTTEPTVGALSDAWRSSVRQIDVATIRGKRDEIAMFEVVWQREDVTQMAAMTFRAPAAQQKKPRLVLEYQGTTVECGDGHNSVVMGRQESNDLVVRHDMISRLHARIEYRRGNFVLIDQSINGTYVRTDRGEDAFVRRDAFTLHGSGVLGLGQPLTGDPSEGVCYQIVD